MRRASIHDLPLFAEDRDLSAAILGAGRLQEWTQLVPILERKGFPRVDALTGGRYVPAVLAFFQSQYGMGSQPAPAPVTQEDATVWTRARKRRA